MSNFENNPFYKEEAKKKEVNWAIRILQPIAIVAILMLVSWFTLLGQNQVDGPSMRANFYTGEFLLINRFPALLGEGASKAIGINYERGDIVILLVPGEKEFVKRVIGLPGEKINIDKGRVFINGQVLVEDYLAEELYTNGGDFLVEGAAPIEIPTGNIITIGDNRPESNDSRYAGIGLIKREWIKGTVFLRIWPFDTFGYLGRGTYSFADPNTYDFSKADEDFRYSKTRVDCVNLKQCYYSN
jgi:signal peptidase I